MNTLFIFAQSNVPLNALGGYTWLTILIPVMIFMIALFLFIALFILSSMSDKLTDIRDRLTEGREVDEALAEAVETKDITTSMEAKRASVITEQKATRDKANTRSIFIWGAIIAIPILLILFVLIYNLI